MDKYKGENWIRCFNITVFLGSTRDGNSSMERTRFFLEPDFSHESNIASALVNGVGLLSYHILMRKHFNPLWSKLS